MACSEPVELRFRCCGLRRRHVSSYLRSSLCSVLGARRICTQNTSCVFWGSTQETSSLWDGRALGPRIIRVPAHLERRAAGGHTCSVLSSNSTQAHRPLPPLRAMTSALSALLVGAIAGLAGPADALVITALLPAVANFRDTPVSEKRPLRLDWDAHCQKLQRRCKFSRYYRLPALKFMLLANALKVPAGWSSSCSVWHGAAHTAPFSAELRLSMTMRYLAGGSSTPSSSALSERTAERHPGLHTAHRSRPCSVTGTADWRQLQHTHRFRVIFSPHEGL